MPLVRFSHDVMTLLIVVYGIECLFVCCTLIEIVNQRAIHASVGECWGKNTCLTYTGINWDVVGDGANTPYSTLCIRIQPGYQVDESWGIPRRARILQVHLGSSSRTP